MKITIPVFLIGFGLGVVATAVFNQYIVMAFLGVLFLLIGLFYLPEEEMEEEE